MTANCLDTDMIYLKAAVVGVAVAALFALIPFAIITAWLMFAVRSTQGSGGLGAVSVGANWALPFTFMGFALGFWRTLHHAGSD